MSFGFNEKDIFCNIARSTFSISLFDLLLPFCCGASLRILKLLDVLELSYLIEQLNISTVVHAGPVLLNALSTYCIFHFGKKFQLKSIRHVSTGGEMVSPTVMDKICRLFQNADRFILYGATEIACMGTMYPINANKIPNESVVRKAFEGVEICLQYDSGELSVEAPTNYLNPSEGEILISGNGVAMGYWNNSALTQEMFEYIDGKRWYHTGDWGRFHQNTHDLEILGRRDFQVKYSGVRMDLGAIENLLSQLELVSQAIVLFNSKAGLVAFCVLNKTSNALNKESLSINSDDEALPFDKNRNRYLQRHLAKNLPAEMLPSAYLWFNKFPVNFNGKIDRNRLLLIAEEQFAMSYKNDVGILNIPSKIAFIKNIFYRRVQDGNHGLNDSYFELGGKSIGAIEILSTIRKYLGIHVSVGHFFKNPTLAFLLSELNKTESVISDE